MPCNRNVIEGLFILSRGREDKYDLAAEHDQIWAGGDDPLGEGERSRLLALGWHFDREIDRWSAFV